MMTASESQCEDHGEAQGIASITGLPDAVQRSVRSRCGHGCTRCGVTIYQYWRLPPEARAEGEADGDITLLCPPCASLLQAHPSSPEQLRILNQRPIARQEGFARDRLPYHHLVPRITIAGQTLRDTPWPISVGGAPLILVQPPESGVGATCLDLWMGDAEGRPMPRVRNNEWLPAGDWTYEWRGPRFAMHSRSEGSLLALCFLSRSHIMVEELVTRINGHSLVATEAWLEVDGVRRDDKWASSSFIGLDI